jgi:hypothetical protein
MFMAVSTPQVIPIQSRNSCVRVFEQKIKLKEVSSDKSYTTMTAVILVKT